MEEKCSEEPILSERIIILNLLKLDLIWSVLRLAGCRAGLVLLMMFNIAIYIKVDLKCYVVFQCKIAQM